VVVVPACRSLFDGLAFGGDVALRRTLYYPPEVLGLEGKCRLGGIAHTARPANRSPTLASLPVERAALVLIHEALHFAGLPESPTTRAR
jgi:hypothetical protein